MSTTGKIERRTTPKTPTKINCVKESAKTNIDNSIANGDDLKQKLIWKQMHIEKTVQLSKQLSNGGTGTGVHCNDSIKRTVLSVQLSQPSFRHYK